MDYPKSMYSVLRPMFFVSKFYGLAPFNVAPNKVEGSKLSVLWSIVVVAILVTFSLISVVQRPKKQYNSHMLNVGDDISVYMDVIGMSVSITCGILYRNSIIQALNQLADIDKEMKLCNYVSDLQKLYTRYKKIVIFLTASLNLYFLIYIIVNVTTFFETLTVTFVGNVIAYVWPTVIDGFIELQFCVLIIIVKQRVQWLNGKLNEVGEILWNSKFTDHNPTAIIMMSKYFHQKLCDVAELINSAYSFQLLLTLSALYLNSIMTLFYWALQSVPENQTEIFIADVIYMNNKFVFGLIQIIVLVYACSSTSREMKTFIDLLSPIDKRFKNYNDLSKIYGSTGRWVMTGVVSAISCFLVLLIIQLIVIWEGSDYTFLSDLVTITLPMGLTMASQLEFCVLTVLVEQRLSWLCSAIKPEYKTESTQKMIRISKVKTYYRSLSNVIGQMHTKFSVEILMVVLKNFVGLIVLLCFWITKVDVAYGRTSAASTVYLSLLLISLGAQIIIPAMVCSRYVQKAKKTGTLIHSIVPPSHLLKNRETLQIQLSCFSLQLANHNIEFNACGVFFINESLIYSIIGAASAYLVIVIQFELSSNSALTINNRTVIVAS